MNFPEHLRKYTYFLSIYVKILIVFYGSEKSTRYSLIPLLSCYSPANHMPACSRGFPNSQDTIFQMHTHATPFQGELEDALGYHLLGYYCLFCFLPLYPPSFQGGVHTFDERGTSSRPLYLCLSSLTSSIFICKLNVSPGPLRVE